jgi:hypothetical protein
MPLLRGFHGSGSLRILPQEGIAQGGIGRHPRSRGHARTEGKSGLADIRDRSGMPERKANRRLSGIVRQAAGSRAAGVKTVPSAARPPRRDRTGPRTAIRPHHDSGANRSRARFAAVAPLVVVSGMFCGEHADNEITRDVGAIARYSRLLYTNCAVFEVWASLHDRSCARGSAVKGGEPPASQRERGLVRVVGLR